MREATGNTFVYNIVIAMVLLAMLVLVASLSYSKGFKAKNKIIAIIEENRGYDDVAMKNIDKLLKESGYRPKSVYSINSCPIRRGKQLLEESNNHMYCVYANTSERGMYYSVTIYIRFEIPLLSGLLEFPVSGDTKTIYDLM